MINRASAASNMATYRVVLIARNPTREIISHFPGSVDAEDAEAKAREVYDVFKVKKVELVPEKKEKKKDAKG
jgi:hypothetical protein